MIQIEMADTYKALRKFGAAVDAYTEVLASRQLNEKGQLMIYASLAQALVGANRIDDALDAISEAIKLDDNDYRLLHLRVIDLRSSPATLG